MQKTTLADRDVIRHLAAQIMKDISTVRNDPARLKRWAAIAMEEAKTHAF